MSPLSPFSPLSLLSPLFPLIAPFPLSPRSSLSPLFSLSPRSSLSPLSPLFLSGAVGFHRAFCGGARRRVDLHLHVVVAMLIELRLAAYVDAERLVEALVLLGYDD